MINKRCEAALALRDIQDGAVLLVGGFGATGRPDELLRAVYDSGAGDLSIVANNVTDGPDAIGDLLRAGRIRKITCSYPRGLNGPTIFDELYKQGRVQLELAPQGTLAERIRAGAAGIGGFFTRTAAGTALAAGKEVRSIDGQDHVLESPIRGDFALIKALRGDRWGNLVYHRGARVNNPVMAGAAAITVVQVGELVELGALDPEHIVTPAALVDRLVEVK